MPKSRDKDRWALLYLLIFKIKVCEVEGAECLPLQDEKLRIRETSPWQQALNTGKSMDYKTWHTDRNFFFWVLDFFPLVVPVAVYSHRLLCFCHLQKGLASGGGACSCCLEEELAPSNSISRPCSSVHWVRPFEISPFLSSVQQVSVEGLLSTRRCVGPRKKMNPLSALPSKSS